MTDPKEPPVDPAAEDAIAAARARRAARTAAPARGSRAPAAPEPTAVEPTVAEAVAATKKAPEAKGKSEPTTKPADKPKDVFSEAEKPKAEKPKAEKKEKPAKAPKRPKVPGPQQRVLINAIVALESAPGAEVSSKEVIGKAVELGFEGKKESLSTVLSDMRPIGWVVRGDRGHYALTAEGRAAYEAGSKP